MKALKRAFCALLALCMLLCAACSSGSTAETAAPATAEDAQPAAATPREEPKDPDAPDYEHMTMEELYALAKAEGGVIRVYATSASANSAIKKIKKVYPDLDFEYISCDTNTISAKIEMEADTGNTNADVVLVNDNSGEIYNELVLYDYLQIFRPAKVCEHIDESLLTYGLPLYSTFYPWFYNTEMFPDGSGIESWWDITAGYNVDTCSYKDAAGNNTQKWTIFSKDITGPSYASLFAQMIVDGDLLAAQYEKQYGEPLTFTYQKALNNTPGIMEFPENNAGVELFWRFSQLAIIPNPDGDGVVEAVDNSINGPTIGLCSASKLDNSENGYHVDWVYGLAPYTGFQACNYSYVVSGCDNPAGARLFILYMMGGDDGSSGCYPVFDATGYWSIRDDVEYHKTALTAEDIVLTSPTLDEIYQYYPNVKAYWTYWHSLVE